MQPSSLVTNVNQGYDIITPLVHVANINRALDFNGQGTHLAGQARAAQVLHSFRASYGGFIDHHTHAIDNQRPSVLSTLDLVQERPSHSRTPSIPDEPILLAKETCTSSSRGYSPSLPHKQEMSQPIDLSILLNLPGRGWGRGTFSGHGNSQGRGVTQSHGTSHSLKAVVQSDVPPGFSHEEIAAGHRDKCQRPNPTSTVLRELNAENLEQFADDVDKKRWKCSQPGQKEASGGNNADSTAAEDNTVQATLAAIQDLTQEE
ncbi:hypothetical protein RHSIM_Rhsim02G0145400 [Rhododendron simsii]|uniref:Uncharacterized protein n=1 Tax=Rhododendron simsii TaxID=118357 RepID=A0A834HHX7_RHOSS|nr:hypothetical protein RHSIM_Rhsim02G0145400 [Rhododendron simsii]